ncbi:MAG: alpha-amylase family glycosyl hydrolase [Bacillota bacterium]
MGKLHYGKKFLLTVVLFSLVITVAFAGNSLKVTQHDITYFLMTDRFYDGDLSNDQDVHKRDLSAYHGGDFQGIIDKLDYIKDLGFTTIWISPVVANQIRGYHGYWATDFYKTNEHFGSLEKLKELVARAHEKGLKVIVDLVVNHTGRMHPWASDPRYESWFHHQGNIQNWNDQQEVENGMLASLPDLNQDNPEVAKYLIGMAKWWIAETGIDGYRLDTVRHVPKSFWKDFVTEIKKDYPGFYMIGEVFDGRPDYLAGYQQTGIDGLINYPVYFALNDVFAGGRPADRLVGVIQQCVAVYPNQYLMGTVIDTQDVPRFISQASGQYAQERLKQALAFLMTYTGIPVMYYGTEIGLEGGDDPNNRRDMDWMVKSPLTDYVKKLTVIRKTNKALTDGDFKIIGIDQDFLSYYRRFEGNIILTVFNLSDQQQKITLSLPAEFQTAKGQLTELTGYQSQKTVKGKVKLKIGPRQVYIFSYTTIKP